MKEDTVSQPNQIFRIFKSNKLSKKNLYIIKESENE
jgi:hypothetical protein